MNGPADAPAGGRGPTCGLRGGFNVGDLPSAALKEDGGGRLT